MKSEGPIPKGLPPVLNFEQLVMKESDVCSTGSNRLSNRQVAEIRYRYLKATAREKRAFKKSPGLKRRLADEYGVSDVSIRKILERETYPHVIPEIPAIGERGHGMAVATDREIQQIRATAAKHRDDKGHLPKGLLTAMARYFHLSKGYIGKILSRDCRIDVADDNSAFSTLEELEIKDLKKRGEDHANSVLENVDVLEIYRLHNEEGLGASEILRRMGNPVSLTLVCNILKGRTWKHLYKEYHGHPPKGK